MREPVKPHGRLPWFFTASQALAAQLRGRRDGRRDSSASIRTGEDGWDYQDRLGSKASNQEPQLESVVHPMPTTPVKVLRKM
jgi:AGZA family xanthine/uracil permease-like MFS transporter